MQRHLHAVGSFLPRKQVKSSCQWRGNRRNVALCPACGLGSRPSYWGAWPRRCSWELASSRLGSPLGTGAPLQGPSLRMQTTEPTASKMAGRCPLFRGDKRPFLQNQPLLCNKHECPHRREACRWEKLVLGKLFYRKRCCFTPGFAGHGHDNVRAKGRAL